MEATLQYQVPFFNKSLFDVLETLWWNRRPTNTSVKPIPHMLDEIRSGLTFGNLIFSMYSSRENALVISLDTAWWMSTCMETPW
jgi:hypothetical protein